MLIDGGKCSGANGSADENGGETVVCAVSWMLLV
jgi:hypothetical protein